MTFQFDTSGSVVIDLGPNAQEVAISFGDLSPFVQGYIEALFESGRHGWALKPGRNGIHAGFSDLAPETLAQIMEDCERFTSQLQADYTEAQMRTMGGDFWHCRNDTHSLTGLPTLVRSRPFPPLTPSIGDDAKVYLRDALQDQKEGRA